MGAITSLQQERDAVSQVLRSGVFAKAPRLERFFRYICERYFEGQADRIKEYGIAVEALGRPAEFDPKKDSIVRVEAHRLRKRLEDYYRGPGANDPIQILIPNGQYAPQFAARGSLPVFFGLEPQPNTAGLPFPRRWAIPLAILILCGAAAVLALQAHRRPATALRSDEIWQPNRMGFSITGEFHMLAGYHGSPFVDRQGHIWIPDAYYTGGVSAAIPPGQLIEGQPDPHLLRSMRFGKFRYDIPLQHATYELHLYFAETQYGAGNPKGLGDGARMFQVSINGKPVLNLFDPLAEAGGPNRLLVRVFKDVAPAADGKLHIAFDPTTKDAFLNALEILPTPAGRIHPVRIVTQPAPVTDAGGRLWAADEYFFGGTPVYREWAMLDNPERTLYQGERYGNFSYHIPLAPGKYRLTLHFAEMWFGTPESHLPAFHQRFFNVFANGVALLRDYDIAADAGGSNRCLEKDFENLEPNAQGMLLLQFVPVKNYAEVNAIEVVETQ